MEAFKYLFFLIILIISICFGFYAFFKGFKQRDSTLKIVSFVFISFPVIIILYNLFPNVLTEKPNEKDLIGIYKIISAKNEIPKSDFDKYILKLKEDMTFEITQTPGISLCENGKYEIDFAFEGNELSFQCGQGWTSAQIKRNVFGFEIEFFNSEEEIRFVKID